MYKLFNTLFCEVAMRTDLPKNQLADDLTQHLVVHSLNSRRRLFKKPRKWVLYTILEVATLPVYH